MSWPCITFFPVLRNNHITMPQVPYNSFAFLHLLRFCTDQKQTPEHNDFSLQLSPTSLGFHFLTAQYPNSSGSSFTASLHIPSVLYLSGTSSNMYMVLQLFHASPEFYSSEDSILESLFLLKDLPTP